ncbi:MAG: hypothetical protein ABWW69_05155 [Pyrodictiaceae archaeon]
MACALPSLSSLLRELGPKVNGLRGFELVSLLSTMHRVQGGEEIVVAAERVAASLDEHGVEYRLERYTGPLGLHERWGFWEPRGWRLLEAEILVEGKLYASAREHPLLVAAGSPAGEAEGKAERLADLLEASKLSSKIVVVEGFRREHYWRLEKLGERPDLIIAFHRGPGIRYYSIFPPYFRSPPTIMVMSLDEKRAFGLQRKRIRARIEASYGLAEIPILHAWVGYEKDPGILLIAHICHPKPGAHDNASGVAVVAEALATLRSYEHVFKEYGLSVHALIVPEYTGTAIAFDMSLVEPEILIAATSIDMVGADYNVTGGAPLYYQSLYMLASPLDPVLYRGLYLAHSTSEGFSGERYPERGVHLLPYSWGSDHDIAASLGIPSSLVNDWPDKYYHTSMDYPSNLSIENLARTIAALSSALIYMAYERQKLGKLLEDWIAYTSQKLLVDSLTTSQETAEMVRGMSGKMRDKSLERLYSILRRGEAPKPPRARIRGPISASYLELLAKSDIREKLSQVSNTGLYLGLASIALSALGPHGALIELRIRVGNRLNEEALSQVSSLMGLEEDS